MFGSSFRLRLRQKLSFCVLLAAPLLLAQTAPVWAAKKTAEAEPILLQADTLTHDDTAQTITALGHVEIARGGQILRADKITYDQQTDVAHAEGNVALLQPTGEVLFTETADLTSDLREGFIEKVRILFPDHSRLVAQDAERYEGRYLVAERGVYTSCELCKDNPDDPPLWQMKAEQVTHDAEEKEVIYRNATVEFDGVPLFYTPYFSHPDPTVKRQQGFLMPFAGYSQYIGGFVRTPYYVDLAQNDDATLTPTFSDTDGGQLGVEWRHRFADGSMKWNMSGTQTNLVNDSGIDKGDQVRGHLFGTTLFNIDNVWRAGSDIALTTDKSYLRRYAISSEDLLVNRAYLEGFKGRDYFGTNMYYFQDLRTGAQQAEPFVAPDMTFSLLGEPGKTFGGRWSFDGGVLVTTRDTNVPIAQQGPDTRRLALSTGWERQLISQTGLVTTLSGQARVDNYWADNVPLTNDAGDTTGFNQERRTRPFAQGDAIVRYPLGRHGDDYQQTIEPIGMFSVAPSMKKYATLPNEDSLDVEFDETNIFSTNRFSGIDRIEGGTRAAYGLRQTLIGDNGARIEALAGQVYRFKNDDTFPSGSGLREQFSDYVGRVDFSPTKWFDMNYGLRLDKETARVQRQEAQISVGQPVFRPFINYLSVRDSDVSATTASTAPRWIEEGTTGFTSNFAKYWTIGASHKQAFHPNPGARTSAVNMAYGDECFQIGFTGSYDNTNRADLKSGLSGVFHFYLRNIGGFHTDSVTSASFQTPSLQTPSSTPISDQNP